MTEFAIETEDIPKDAPPDFTPPPSDPDSPDNPSNWYNPEYPHSTREHPYGFFPDKDGQPDYSRPRKRRPHSRRSETVGRTTMASDKQARTAAALLARLNGLIGVGISVFLPMTAEELSKANIGFEEMAYAALLNDPDLCRRIMAAGTSSGRAQLTLAYAMLGGSLAPLAYAEIKSKRNVVDQDGRNVA